mgnify:FL=1|jgi:hypothetical protein
MTKIYLNFQGLGVQDALFRKIENATFALHNCTNTGSEWGIQYWQTVLNALNRQSDRVLN